MAKIRDLVSSRRATRTFYFVGCVFLGGCVPGREVAPTVIELRPSGQTAFMPDSITAAAGSQVVLRVINETELAHNVVVVIDPDAVEDIVLAAFQAIRTEYVPTGFEDAILASTPLVYPGETFELSFEVPEPGRYTYVCVFPTHGASMRGTLVSLP